MRSWVGSAEGSDFPLENLPLGIFSVGERRRRSGVAIGDYVVDLVGIGDLLEEDWREDLSQPVLNGWLSRGPEAQGSLRGRLQELLSDEKYRNDVEPQLVGQTEVRLHVPCLVGDYTDFYASIHHATTVGKQFRPDNPLLPNYKWVPIGYHGRASSIGISGESFRRPVGQTKAPDAAVPSFGPSKRLDYELEVAAFVARPNAQGEPVSIREAEAHLFGLALFNDWSSRDIQGWEYQPLGPFLSKNFASTLSPWLVTMEALAPFRAPFVRPEGDPPPLPYLDDASNRVRGALDVNLEVWISTAAMRNARLPPQRLMRSNFKDSYWTVAQMVAHHTVNGCNLQPGDLFGSGTQSGSDPGQGGSMLELASGGKEPLMLANGESRSFLDDGDTVILRGYCDREGYRRIGFGDCAGTIVAA